MPMPTTPLRTRSSLRTTARWTLSLLALLGVASCGNRDGSAPDEPLQCVRVDVANLALSADAACTVASRPLSERFLPDLGFTPGLCYTTSSVPIQVVASDGATTELRITAYSGIDANTVASAALAPFPVPLTDAQGVSHAYLAFTAASVIEVTALDGASLGALVTRDAGWAELAPPSTIPAFVSERLSITGSSGDLLAGVVGEVIATGDEFKGLPAHGSLCAPGIEQRFARL
jgi:hypothetical protein